MPQRTSELCGNGFFFLGPPCDLEGCPSAVAVNKSSAAPAVGSLSAEGDGHVGRRVWGRTRQSGRERLLKPLATELLHEAALQSQQGLPQQEAWLQDPKWKKKTLAEGYRVWSRGWIRVVVRFHPTTNIEDLGVLVQGNSNGASQNVQNA